MRSWMGWAALAAAFGVVALQGQPLSPQLIAPGVWFLLGDAAKGYSNTVVIEIKNNLIVVDANYPARAREIIGGLKQLSPKPVHYVFDTHAHGDHSYGNSVWTAAGATTLAYAGVVEEMDRYEPTRWQAAEAKRPDVREMHEETVQRPRETFKGRRFVVKDAWREVDFLYLGWGHTPADGYVWLPKERVLCTGDGAVNGPRNKMWDANIANWPRVLAEALRLKPLSVLPGHGESGGSEIITGQRQFLLDLYQAVKQQAGQGTPLAKLSVHLPARDENWIPKDLSMDIEIVYTEISRHQPAGALPHEWR